MQTTGNVNVYFQNSLLHFSLNTCGICLNASISKFEISRWHSGKESTCQFRRHRHVSSIPGSGSSLEQGMATYSSILAWIIPRTEEPGGIQFMWSQSDTSKHTHTHRLKIIRRSFISFCFFLHRCWQYSDLMVAGRFLPTRLYFRGRVRHFSS